MRKRLVYLIIIVAVTTGIAKSQSTVNDTSAVLEKLYDRLLSNYMDVDRIRINDSIKTIIGSYVKSGNVFNHRFENLRYLGQITSPDSLLKIVTWNLVAGSGQSRYFCYLIRKQETGSKNRVYALSTLYKEARINTDTTYFETDWYGALYYDVKPYITDNGKCWLLLGIDYGNPLVSRKLIDVLSFTPEGNVVFGRKWFDTGEKKKYRDVFEYASNGMMSLRFSSDSSVVFDHLVPFAPNLKDDRQFYGPDYSYDAYVFRNGLWKLTINVDARNKE
jgi:hypothetical protein